MLTFSQIVDRVVARSGRPDRLQDAQDFVNQTIRDAHTSPDNLAVLYPKNLVEDQLATTTSAPYIWTPPRNIQRMMTVRYPGVITPKYPTGVYPDFRQPGRGQIDVDYLYYRAGAYFAFAGCGESGSTIDVAYYAYPQRLAYYAEALRPASFDLETQTWTYLSAVSEADQLAARELVSNWLIYDWYDYVMEGSMSKMFKLVGDTERAATHYSAYQQLKKTLFSSEAVESIAR